MDPTSELPAPGERGSPFFGAGVFDGARRFPALAASKLRGL